MKRLVIVSLTSLSSLVLLLSAAYSSGESLGSGASAPIIVAQATATKPKPETQPKAAKQPDVIFVPTPQEVVDRMLEIADVKKGDILYDLGCGDGRIVVTAAKKYGVHATGFDVDP